MTRSPGPLRALRVVAGVAVAVCIGMGMALQTRGNGELGRVWADPFAAALWSFGTGLVIVVAACLALRRGRRGLVRIPAAVRSGELPVWALGGGVVGASFVLAQAAVSPLLGVALFTVGTVAGQSIGGILIDRWGIGPGGPRPVTPTRVLGGAAMVVAVIWGASAGMSAAAPWLAMAVPIAIGIAMGWQQAANGRVRRAADSALVATVGNFGVGTLLLGLAFAVHAATAGLPRPGVAPGWAYLGGAIGVVYIAASSVLVHQLGVLLLSLGAVAGQVLGSLLVDVLLPAGDHVVTFATIGSAVLAVLAVAITAIPSLWPRGRRPSV